MKTPSIENIEKLGDKMCAICRDEMAPDFCKILNCGHIYHTICLQDWLRRQYCCPTCLVPITSPIKGNDVTMKNTIYQKSRNKQLNIIAAVAGFSSTKNDYNTVYLDKKNSKL